MWQLAHGTTILGCVSFDKFIFVIDWKTSTKISLLKLNNLMNSFSDKKIGILRKKHY